MAKRKSKRRKKENKKPVKSNVFNCGLFTAVQKGKNVELTGNLSEEGRRKFLDSIPERLELLKVEIDKDIKRVLEIFESNNPIELLKHLFL